MTLALPRTLAEALSRAVELWRARPGLQAHGERQRIRCAHGTVEVEVRRIGGELRVAEVVVRGWAPSSAELADARLRWVRGAQVDGLAGVLEPIGMPDELAVGAA